MSSGRFESRAALSVCIALSLTSPAAVVPLRAAHAQTLSQPPPLRGSEAPGDPLGFGGGLRSGASAERSSSAAANYGPPRAKVRLPKPYPPPARPAPAPFSPRHPLPPLEPYRTSAQARARASHAARLRASPAAPAPPPATVAATPVIKTKPKPRVEEKPYDPVGIGIGSLRLTPVAEAAYGYDSNPNRLSSDVHGSRYFRVDAGFKLKSEWERDDFQADLRLGYADYFSVSGADRPDGVGYFAGRYDVARDTAIKLEGRFSLDTQRPGDPALSSSLSNVVVTNRPAIVAAGTSLGVTQKFNRLELTLRGSFDRTTYENAHYSDGSTLDLASSDYNAYGGSVRAAYELTPDVKPFVETALDKRVHDAFLDVYGFARDGHGFAMRGGTTIKITDLLKGEASGGYAERSYEDPRLTKLRGPTIDAALIYTATPLTTLTLRSSTTLDETTVSGAAGVLSRIVAAQVSHELLRNLTLTAIGAYATNDYQGAGIFEKAYSAGLQLEYNVTRSIAIKGSYSFEHLHSTTPGSDYTANVFLIGLRLQH